MKETQQTIGEWAVATFPVKAGLSPDYFLRLLEETVELCREAGAYPEDIVATVHVALDDIRQKRTRDGFTGRSRPERVPAELADCDILLKTIAHRQQIDLGAEVDRKMAVNRMSQWRLSGNGCGYRIPDNQVIVASQEEPGEPT